jgi:hypothetical protein
MIDRECFRVQTPKRSCKPAAQVCAQEGATLLQDTLGSVLRKGEVRMGQVVTVIAWGQTMATAIPGDGRRSFSCDCSYGQGAPG